jgi:hypothetical protein
MYPLKRIEQDARCIEKRAQGWLKWMAYVVFDKLALLAKKKDMHFCKNKRFLYFKE